MVEPGRLRFAHVTIDCLDADRLVDFWRPLIGTEREPVRVDNIVYLAWDVGAGSLCFQEVPEPRVSKNRVHLDFVVSDIAILTDRVVALGGRVVADMNTDDGSWRVLADPEGNEFCIASA